MKALCWADDSSRSEMPLSNEFAIRKFNKDKFGIAILFVGVIVGFLVGDGEDGTKLGLLVGGIVGVVEGFLEGESVGARLINLEGESVGKPVGIFVGFLLGENVGISLGISVGTPVGVLVGFLLGEKVGIAFGISAGCSECFGTGVGPMLNDCKIVTGDRGLTLSNWNCSPPVAIATSSVALKESKVSFSSVR